MRTPTSASEDDAHGAEKIGLSRYSDFFRQNRPRAEVLCPDYPPIRQPFPTDFDFSKFRGTAAFPGSAHGRSVLRGDTMLLPGRFVSKGEIKKTLAQDGFAVVWGHIEYIDVFKSPHHAEFCITVNPSPDGSDFSLNLLKSECNTSE